MGAINSIGGFLPALSGFASTLQGINSVYQTFAGVGDSTEIEQLRERQALEEQQLTERNTLERERLALEAQDNEESRRAALRRAVARQRASFGGQGIGAGGGSSQAVLLGLYDETEEELRRRGQLDNLRSRALDLENAQVRSLNLLQASQLAQRERLNRLF